MAESDGMAVYVGQYASVDDAKDDYQKIEELHQGGFFGDYDAALFDKQPDGSIKVLDTDETPRAEWAVRAGFAGAVLGLLFPEFLLLAAGGAAALGAVAGHIRGGLRRADLNELGETLDKGQAGIVLIVERPIEDASALIMQRATSTLTKPVGVTPETVKKAAGQTSG